MSLVFDGKKVDIEGIESASFLDDKKYAFTNKRDFTVRKVKPQSICLHTRMGVWPQILVNETKDRRWDELGVKRASADERVASWHISIDSDGSFVCHLDLITIEAYHCSQVNPYSIGIEMYQELDGTITEATLNTAAKICETICNELSIAKQFPSSNSIIVEFARPDGKAHKTKKRAYMAGGLSGKEFFGVFGHRNATRNRGKGDPGDLVFDKLAKLGFIRLDI